ncbi:uncharacterized protein LOC128391758 [Panonychus citri]|uniref:uncharacterized protein LOC128391758 n=1 Tax=Panonychus citri TaxID=50023 RepID=UPI0023077459|nr:uncharacterized protein LOC128391758 [Panonychus citri]
MKTFQLIVTFLCFYGAQCTTIRVGHKQDSFENSLSSLNFGSVDSLMNPLKSSLQKATAAICHATKLCHHEMLNKEPFRSLLGEYIHDESHRSPLSFMSGLFPTDTVSTAMKDVLGGIKNAELDVLLSPIKKMMSNIVG